MLEVSHLTPTDYLSRPWKNGRGMTHDIAADHQHPARWRLSTSELRENAPFSIFPGYDRVLILLRGGPVMLNHGDGNEDWNGLPPLSSYTFSGEQSTRAKVIATAQDFNVFALREKAKATVYPTAILEREQTQFPLAGQEHFLFCVRGNIEVLEQTNDRNFSLNENDTLRFSRISKKEYLNVRAEGRKPRSFCLWIVIHHL
jgi:environmental stress-induced protein Ves